MSRTVLTGLSLCSNYHQRRVVFAIYICSSLQGGSRLVLSIHVDRGSLSTNHKLASQNSSNADVSTAGLQFSSGQTSMQVQAKTENK